jgi:hypothetical protein
VLQAHVFVPASVLAHVAFGEQPPLFVKHELTAAQTVPSPE